MDDSGRMARVTPVGSFRTVGIGLELAGIRCVSLNSKVTSKRGVGGLYCGPTPNKTVGASRAYVLIACLLSSVVLRLLSVRANNLPTHTLSNHEPIRSFLGVSPAFHSLLNPRTALAQLIRRRIIGCGWISSMFVKDLCVVRPDVTDVAHSIAAVGSRDTSKAEAFIAENCPKGGPAQSNGLVEAGPVACGSYQEVYENKVSSYQWSVVTAPVS